MEKKNCCGFPGNLCLVDSTLFYSNLAEGGGISVLDLVSGENSVVVKGGESSFPHGLCCRRRFHLFLRHKGPTDQGLTSSYRFWRGRSKRLCWKWRCPEKVRIG